MLRRLTRHPLTQALLARLLVAYLAGVGMTTRWRIVGAENLPPAIGTRAEPLGAIVTFWHERLAVMPIGWRHMRCAMPDLGDIVPQVLVSRHRDGRLIGAVAGRFALDMVHASSSRGGAAGLLTLVRVLAARRVVAITPDGPRGPRRRAAPGVAQLAALSGRPVLPFGMATSRARLLRSWDRMMIPLPFGRGVVVIGAPLHVPRGGEAAALAGIEAALSEACDRADALAGGHALAAAGRAVKAGGGAAAGTG